MTGRTDITAWLDNAFQPENYRDRSMNGLQVHGAEEITGIVLGVDACQALFDRAVELDCNFIIVHHGFFWGSPFPITELWSRRYRTLLNRNMSLYACHLPMDADPEAGHNILIAHELDLQDIHRFGHYKGDMIGFCGNLDAPASRSEMEARLAGKFGEDIRMLNFGPEKIQRIAVVSGDPCDLEMLEEAAAAGIDLFVTGETDHASYHLIRELKLNVAFCGHYATETRALHHLANQLAGAFRIPVHFVDLPTGL